MGNIQTKSSDKSLPDIVDAIAFNYITKQNFEDMKNLSKLEYCDKLIILTSKILNKYLNASTVRYLSQKKGITGERMAKDKILPINKDNIDDYDIKDTVKKRRICIGLAKHYVQVANLFAAIAATINPNYNIINDNTEKLSNIEKKITRHSLCSNRVASLLNNQSIEDFESDFIKGRLTLNPQFCTFNCDTCPTIKTLNQEPGIPELATLYHDKYDYDNGEFNAMSSEMKSIYRENVNSFYKMFTGNDSIPETIQSFSDIKLKDYFDSVNCKNGIYSQPVTGNSSSTLFYNYIENIRSMLEAVSKYHDALLKILDQLFIYEKSKDDKEKKSITINPSLTDSSLELLRESTIEIINNLYLSCERHYIKGIKIYIDIVHKQLLETSKLKLEYLTKINDDIGTLSDDVTNFGNDDLKLLAPESQK